MLRHGGITYSIPKPEEGKDLAGFPPCNVHVIPMTLSRKMRRRITRRGRKFGIAVAFGKFALLLTNSTALASRKRRRKAPYMDRLKRVISFIETMYAQIHQPHFAPSPG